MESGFYTPNPPADGHLYACSEEHRDLLLEKLNNEGVDTSDWFDEFDRDEEDPLPFFMYTEWDENDDEEDENDNEEEE